jgi:HPr kinase/phosphorylase
VQVLGGGEVGYLATLRSAARAQVLGKLCGRRLSCLVVTNGRAVPAGLADLAERRGLALLSTRLDSGQFAERLATLLDARLAPRISMHAGLVDVFGFGILLTGGSGIGKSEAALDLVDRGHRLVADDVVEIVRGSEGLVGTSPELARYHMELRGVGLLDIERLYGVASVKRSQRVQLVVHLERWNRRTDYDRLGLGERRRTILGVRLHEIRMPVAPGRSTAMLIEVAARNRLMKMRGIHSAQRLLDRVEAEAVGGREPRRSRGPRRRE